MIMIRVFLIFGFIFSSSITATFNCGYPAVDFVDTCIHFIEFRKNVERQYFMTATFERARNECTKLRIHDLKWDLPKLNSELKLVELIRLTNAKEFNPPPEIDPMSNKMEGVDYWMGMRRSNDAPLEYLPDAMAEHNFYWIQDNSTVTLQIHGLNFWDEGEPDNYFAREVNPEYRENCVHVRVRGYVHQEPYGYRLAKFRDRPCSAPVNHSWHGSHHFIACESSSQPTTIIVRTTSETVQPPITTDVATQNLRRTTNDPNSTPISESIWIKWWIYFIFGITLISCVVAIVAVVAVFKRGNRRKKPVYTKGRRTKTKWKRTPKFGTIRNIYVKYHDDDDASPSPSPMRSETTTSEISRKPLFKSVKKTAPSVSVISDYERSASDLSAEYSNVLPRSHKTKKKANVLIK